MDVHDIELTMAELVFVAISALLVLALLWHHRGDTHNIEERFRKTWNSWHLQGSVTQSNDRDNVQRMSNGIRSVPGSPKHRDASNGNASPTTSSGRTTSETSSQFAFQNTHSSSPLMDGIDLDNHLNDHYRSSPRSRHRAQSHSVIQTGSGRNSHMDASYRNVNYHSSQSNNRNDSTCSNYSTDMDFWGIEDVDDSNYSRVSVDTNGRRSSMFGDSTPVLKKGRLFTLGGKKLMEKAPKVKMRNYSFKDYYLFYHDSMGTRREFDIRHSQIERTVVRATSGIGDGQEFYSISLRAPGRYLLLGASTEAYRDEWYEFLQDQVELIKQEHDETGGEYEEYRHKGVPTAAEQALLDPPEVAAALAGFDQAWKRGFRKKDLMEASVGKEGKRSSITARTNTDHIISPMHHASFEKE